MSLLFSFTLPLAAALSPTDRLALELDSVLSALSGHARTRPGAALCNKLPFANTAADARTAYTAVGDALSLDRKLWPPMAHPLDTIVPTLQTLQVESRVPLADLANVADALGALDETSRWTGEAPKLSELAAAAAPPERLAAKFANAFERDEDGTTVRLSSDAFPLLRQRRVAVHKAEAALEGAASDLIARGGLADIAAEKDATLQRRDGHLVVPVLPTNKRSAGVEIGSSRSGRTTFVEPHELVPFSSACRSAQASLDACEARLTTALCQLLITQSGALCESVDAAAELDALLARASLALAWEGKVPVVGEEGVLCVRDARHPLLALQALDNGGDASAVKGNSLHLSTFAAVDAEDEAPQGILLTGPNGGGKSVVLKTAALYAVLVRLGLPLPCKSAEGAAPRVDFFQSVTTDLAASQSLADGASSFAAHLRSCKRALADADAARESGGHAIVILDEPGASTDPTQGAAIARAVIEALLDAGAIILAATHSDAIKVFGLAERRLMTGAMARAADGSPLYTMVAGAVGSSHALDAAAREGLPAAVLERAMALGGGDEAESEDGGVRQLREQTEQLVTALQARMAEADKAAEAAAAKAAESAAAADAARVAAARSAKSLKAAEAFLDERSRVLDNMVTRLRKQGVADLELLGETLKALRLVQRDAVECRTRALAALGLQPLNDALPLKRGQSLAYVGVSENLTSDDSDAAFYPLDAVVDDDAMPRDATVKVAIAGSPPAYVPRDELAEWLGGAADDFSNADWDWMGAQVSQLNMGGVSGKVVGNSKKKQKKKGW